jgi:hypothetical protein
VVLVKVEQKELDQWSKNEEINILRTIKRKKANWIGHFLHRNCLLKQIIEGNLEENIEVTRRRERRRK